MTENSKVLEKIKKLMKLSQSGNSNEASLALQRAKELMDKYQISLSDVVLSDVKESQAKPCKAGTLTDYQNGLLDAICRLFGCEAYLDYALVERKYSYDQKIFPVFIGVEPNPEIASYCFDILNKQMEKDRADFMKGIHKNTSKVKKTARANAFALGWVIGIQKEVKKLVPESEVPEVVSQYLKKKHDNGDFGDVSKVRETNVQNNGDFFSGRSKGSKVELRHGMSGGKEHQQLN